MKRLLALLLAWPLYAAAQSYPTKPVRIIVPFPVGGTTDLVARAIQHKLQENLGQQVIIENRSGAGGSIGAAEAARAAPDGYTLLMVFDTHATNHHLFKAAPDPFKAFEHISLMVTSPSALVGVTSFAPNNLREVVAFARSNPGKVTYSTPGSGSSNHLAALLLEQHGGIKMTQVSYGGGGPMTQALLSQQVNISFFSMPPMVPHIKAGKLKGIAVGSRQRMPQLPDVPTLSETFPGFEVTSWFGVLAPAGTPKDVLARVHRDFARSLQTPEIRDKLTDMGFQVVASTPEEFLRWVRTESDKLGRLIRENALEPQ
jgi:tripartite-type tricarboxylate transporter receptor subunit TctC